MKYIFFVAVFFMLVFGSCRTPQNIAYFQGLENISPAQLEAMNQKYVPRICVDDALLIYVTSPDRSTAAPFSVPPYGFYMPGESEIGISATTQNIYTYLVDEYGEINFPVLGRVHLAGLSINEATRKMESLIWETAPTAIVSVQISNFKVSIIGEVNLPETYYIKNSRISILELISRAGDLTVTADRKNIWLHRDNDGEKVHVHFDLTDPMIFASPYYYLQQNDIIYVLPNEAQKQNAVYSLRDATRITLYSAIVTTCSILLSAFLTIRGQNR